ncbi:MAG: diguanylate cyclase, partial [Pseudomonadota bacterium]|nr:diguanylate cyclase [Pseudomonadota bacterium]
MLLTDRRDRLWIATYKGLALHESGRFHAIPAADPAYGPLDVQALTLDARGDVLAGTPVGVFRVRRGKLVLAHALPGPAQALLVDAEGLWVGSRGGIYRIQDGVRSFETLPDAEDATVGQLLRAHGRLWAGSNRGLFFRDLQGAGGWQRHAGNDAQPSKLSTAPVQAMYEDRDQNLWIATIGGLARLRAGVVREFVSDDNPTAFKSVRSIFEDREGNLWLGSQWEGVARMWNGWTRRYSINEGLHDIVVWSLARDPDGRLWVGTNDGLSQFVDGRYQELVSSSDLPHPNVYTMLPERDGLWIGTRRGLTHYRDGRLQVPPGFDALAGAQINGFLRARDSHLWIASTQGLFRHDGETLKLYGTAQGLADPRVRVVHQTRDGRLLVGTHVGLYELAGETLRPLGIGKGLRPDLDVTAIHELADGALVIGALSEEMFLLDGDRWARFANEQGVPVNSPFFITNDGRGMLWVAGIRGVYRVPIADLRAYARGQRKQVRGEMLLNERGDRRSGQKGYCCNGAGMAKGFIEQQRLWLPTRNGVVVLDTQGIVRNPVPPTLMIERVRSGDEWQNANAVAGTTLPSGQRDLGFEFTALSFQEPGSIGLRYRLRGYDPDWRELEDVTRRSVNYTNLPPGPYTFEVQGSNNADVWQRTPARMSFEVRPYFHETSLFRVLLALLLATALFGVYRFQQHRHQRQREALETLVQQRTAALEVANQRLEDASQTDPLTGLRNRRYLANQIPADIAFYGRDLGHPGADGQVLVFALIDIDHFKIINDTHGHKVGDQVLQQFAQVLGRLVRTGDYIVRWGGEEFLLLFRPMPGRHLGLIGERIRTAVAQHPFHVDGSEPLKLTCSTGFAEYPLFIDGRMPLGWEATVELADLALYYVKS